PGTAVDATAATITWHVRDSFIQYINSGEGTTVSGGATADPATVQPGSSVPLVYAFHFPFKSGWYDPVTNTTRLTYSGTVTFCYSGHGIKLTASNPEVEIDGSGSRAIFVTGNTGEADKRGVLVKLDPSAAASITHSPDGHDHAWNQVPGTIPADASESVFAGFYAAGDPFGWITTTATT
ncbi:MAG TPA: HtaA domain-containing protein, partial [Baekduia sp.]|nr:HtaA domain-containing protein [Baekduia sp.]